MLVAERNVTPWIQPEIENGLEEGRRRIELAIQKQIGSRSKPYLYSRSLSFYEYGLGIEALFAKSRPMAADKKHVTDQG